MRFSSVLWLMDTDYLSIFLFSFDYFSASGERMFLLSISNSPFLIFDIFLVLCPIFNLPVLGIRAFS